MKPQNPLNSLSLHPCFRKIGILFGIAGLCLTSYAGTIPLVQNGVNWGTNYYAPSSDEGPGKDGSPTDPEDTSPLWTLNPTATSGSLSLDVSYLQIDTSSTGEKYYFQTAFGNSGSTSGTVEFTAKVVSTTDGSPYAGGMYVGFGKYVWSLQFGSNPNYALQWAGVNYTSADLGGVNFKELTTFRIVLENMTDDYSATASLYLNNSTTPVIVLDSTKLTTPAYTQAILFGQTADSSNQKGVVQWEGIRWDPLNAIAPIPEPTSLILIGIGCLWLGVSVTHKRRNRHAHDA